jgi:hypothetical protein
VGLQIIADDVGDIAGKPFRDTGATELTDNEQVNLWTGSANWLCVAWITLALMKSG